MADYTPISSGDQIRAVSITDRFTEIEDEINLLEETAIQPRSLDSQHFESQILLSKSKAFSGMGTIADPSSGLHFYANMDPNNINTMTTHPFETSPGWTIVRRGGQWDSLMGGNAQTGDELTLMFGPGHSYRPGDTVKGVSGILVMANIEVRKLGPAFLVDAAIGSGQFGTGWLARFGIQARNSDTQAWSSLGHTYRFLEADTLAQHNAVSGNPARTIAGKNFDVGIRALLPDYQHEWDGVRVVTCVRRTHSAGTHSSDPATVGLKNCSLSLVVFHGSRRPF